MSASGGSAAPNDTARRDRLLLVVIVAGSLLGLLWSWSRLSDSRRGAAEAADDLVACRDLAAKVEVLRRRPAVAEGQGLGETDLHRRIAAAAESAGFPDGGLGQIVPEPPRRLEDTPYREDATRVYLHHVTLRELFTFLHTLAAGTPVAGDGTAAALSRSGLRVKSIRLSAPRGEEIGDRWTVETTLTYLVYDPRPPGGATPVVSVP